MSSVNMKLTYDYGFPQEVLELIFLNLDPKTFLTSRQVCKTWRDVLDYLSERKYWKSTCLQHPDLYKPLHEKGILNWKNVYKNSCLWKKINNAIITINDVVQDDGIQHIFVNNKEELCVTQRNKILIKDATTFEDLHSIVGTYEMFVKSEYIAAFWTSYRSLHLQAITSGSSAVKTIDNVKLFRIFGDKCVYLTIDKRIWECSLSNSMPTEFNEPISCTRWYNSDDIVSIHEYEGYVYFLSESGKYLKYMNNRLIQIDTFTWSQCEYINYQRFHLCRENTLIYTNDSLLYVQLKDGRKRDYSDIRLFTCILMHGNMLFLGTDWGKVFIYTINKLEDLLYLQLDKPLMSFSLKGDQAIYGFDVLEQCNAHTLFVRTRSKVTSIHFQHE